MKSLNSSYISRLDHIIFFAASMVVFVHTYTTFGGKLSDNYIIRFLLSGDTGVSLFLVLSGFLFTVISNCGNKHIDYKTFIFNRIVRIFPLFVLVWITAMSLARGNATFTDALSILFFSNLQTSPLLTYFGQTWTIAVELQFYLVFPLLVMFLKKFGVRYIVLLSVFWVCWRFLIVSFFRDSLTSVGMMQTHYFYLTMLGRLDQFLIGMVFGYLYCNHRNLFTNKWLLFISLFLVFVGQTYLHEIGMWYLADPLTSTLSYAEAIIWGLFIISYACCEIKIPKAIDFTLSRLGDLSFSTYILHSIILYSFHKNIGIINITSGQNINAVCNFVIILSLILVFSKFTFELIEKPFLSLRKRYV
ncbi:acyltransferase [Salmonella enterica subsp. enterica serovar Cotham]|nr:acyltransferase [Salmonella enterica]EBL2338680.1 acyltransferase [Salmonella enterica]ECS8658877.1 acyltransferase [Salmonella enterica subsp. enterica serovar Cotham]EDT4287984.1 acyltransferase [Salmonella enterica subsp. enterica serovar Cotham]EDU9115856.1 acyltransferase [Salmonella enterica subsp. enterica serovar Cotham]